MQSPRQQNKSVHHPPQRDDADRDMQRVETAPAAINTREPKACLEGITETEEQHLASIWTNVHRRTIQPQPKKMCRLKPRATTTQDGYRRTVCSLLICVSNRIGSGLGWRTAERDRLHSTPDARFSVLVEKNTNQPKTNA
ncbi:Putative 2-oxoglutarate decarboxylase, component of the 2-oxoglutarate dehydrogenase complex (E1) (sucA) [Anopheles sinensis]|uniref:Putative 2-oxoglutarate decarboxylase, component of the 2-oxoglutarate dehydrogenase complex (E1) (SucA) n=1 Tax=Anopheles sinensis TaxID=74873 RepID=A0A084VTS1_ANOSI|nr:Putative 2-oxoglutarate decarboxylase, component of the 2-oxoglutarate dehydrogenase complex (E1) (sucA) [Anopheles sinensis]